MSAHFLLARWTANLATSYQRRRSQIVCVMLIFSGSLLCGIQGSDSCVVVLPQDPSAMPRPTSQDLAGFWDLLQLSIDDVTSKFDELQRIKSNDWRPIESPEKKVCAEDWVNQSSCLSLFQCLCLVAGGGIVDSIPCTGLFNLKTTLQFYTESVMHSF